MGLKSRNKRLRSKLQPVREAVARLEEPEVAPEPPKPVVVFSEKNTVAQLREIAKKLCISLPTKANKAEILFIMSAKA